MSKLRQDADAIIQAAITAAKGGHSVTLLERQARVGRKLLSTGNGRCNLTNLNMGLPYYHGPVSYTHLTLPTN